MSTTVPVGDGIPAAFYRNAIDLNRFSNTISKKLVNSYNNVILRAVEQLEKIEKQPLSKQPAYKAARLRALIKQTKKSLDTWADGSVDELIQDLEGVARVQSGFIEDQLKKSMPKGMQEKITNQLGYSVNSVAISSSFAKSVVKTDPTDLNIAVLRSDLAGAKTPKGTFKLTAKEGQTITLPNGQTVKKAFRGLAKSQTQMFNQVVRTGLLSNEPTADIARQLVGSLGFEEAGSLADITLRGGQITKMANGQVMNIVRTTVNQVTNTASQAVYKANPDVTEEYRYVATLDSRTSPVCRDLDGQIFKYNEGPVPPQHFGCRSTTVAVINYKKWGFTPPPAGKRASVDGPVPANTTYGKWLYNQRQKGSKFKPGAEQIAALGNTKAKYFNRLSDKYGPDQALKKLIREDNTEVSLVQLKKRYGDPDDIKIKASKVVRERPKAKQSWQRFSDGSLTKGSEPSAVTRWTKDRQKLHDKIVEDVINQNNPKAQKNPEFFMTGGGSAAGKSIMLKKSPLPKGTVVIDSDEIKKLIPEYVAMQKKGGEIMEAAASYVHEESSWLSKRIMKEAAKRRYHTMLDGTGNNSLQSLQKKVNQMKDRGMKVKAKYATADIETALERNWQRFLKTERLVPPTYVRDVHRNVSKVVPDALQAGVFDDFELYDMNKSGEAIRVATYTKEGGMIIERPDLYDKFVGKAYKPDSLFTKWTDRKKPTK